jgi:glutamate-ammonia-ligase adenylyltransferase
MNLYNHYFAEFVPAKLQPSAQKAIAKLLASLSEQQLKRLTFLLDEQALLKEQLVRALMGSEYVLQCCCADPDLLFYPLLTDAAFSPLTPVKIFDAIEIACSDNLSVDEFNDLLRRLRRNFMTTLYWRDLNGLADFGEVSAAMTALAEAFVQQTLNFNYKLLIEKHGFPVGSATGQIQPMLVIGMGKLGGEELNVSSDIDLIFAFPESGKTEKKYFDSNASIKSIDNQQFFIFLGQRLIKMLNEVTAAGFVFRVDMRLRPYGDSGVLASNFSALENYYETQGRDWERFASVKARVIACTNLAVVKLFSNMKNNADKLSSQLFNEQIIFEKNAVDDFYKILKPFTYRKYIDYSMVESLRKLKAMIVQEVRRKGLKNDVKLGEGGIREIEFIVQSFQLIRGGRERGLQTRNLLSVLTYLGQHNHLETKIVLGLKEAYNFLRKVEHSLQALNDSQTQSLPTDSVACERIAWLLNFKSWIDFIVCLDKHRAIVIREFDKVFSDKDVSDDSSENDVLSWELLWSNLPVESLVDKAIVTKTIASKTIVNKNIVADASSSNGNSAKNKGWMKEYLGDDFSLNEEVLTLIVDRLVVFKSSRKVVALSADAHKKLDTLIPKLLAVLLGQEQQPEQKLEGASLDDNSLSRDRTAKHDEQLTNLISRILSWLESIVMRTSYISLLIENPQIIKHLVTLFKSSSWVVETLTQIPALLDELLNPELLYSLPEKDALKDEMRQRLLRLEPDDIEGQMEVLRYFKLAHYLHVAACEITGSLPLMKVSDYLTLIAEVVLEQVLRFAWSSLVTRHGYPENTTDNATKFLVVGYGKLGGIEMSYSSDLDLVFIYDANPQGMTAGARPLDNQTFYTRLGQKMIHIMNIRSLSGQLYDIDMRLRPSGNSGMLVTSISAFERYQKQEAWIWEHQALVRARGVAGDEFLNQRFIEVRKDVLCQRRDRNELKAAVREMREKMRGHLDGSTKTNTHQTREFHLKQGAGGIVDIEFMVQYAILLWSSKAPSLCQWTDNIRLLESLHDLGLLDVDKSKQLIDIYQLYRIQGHRLALQQSQSSLIDAESFTREREQIKHLWNCFFNDGTNAELSTKE